MPTRSFANRGFTLLEICLVLFIAVLIMGLAVPVTTSLMSEQQLREPARQFELLVKTARRQAVQENRPYEILMSAGGFLLQPVFGAETPGPQPAPETEPESEEGEDVPAPFEPLEYRLPSGVTYLVQRWGWNKAAKPAEDRWIFQGTGLCEPMIIRFQREESWLEISFNPLTASVDDESYYFP
jgi:type II secretory pathway pseudopilin PulG